MTTREAMERATPRPWHVYDRGIGYEVISDTESEYPINDGFRETFAETDCKLIVAAVNSFDLAVKLAELQLTDCASNYCFSMDKCNHCKVARDFLSAAGLEAK